MDSKRPANDEPSAEDIELLADEVAAHVQRKQELDNRLDSQQAGQDSLRLRLKESRNNIRIELDEVLQSSAPRTRLDNMLERHEAAREEETRLAEALEETRAELAREQLQLVQKAKGS
jgi:signal transduction protein with GAF and PtsI domain